MSRFLGLGALLVALAACGGPPRLSADIDASERSIQPTAEFDLAGVGIRIRP